MLDEKLWNSSDSYALLNDIQGETAQFLSLVIAKERCDRHLENSLGAAEHVLERNGGGCKLWSSHLALWLHVCLFKFGSYIALLNSRLRDQTSL